MSALSSAAIFILLGLSFQAGAGSLTSDLHKFHDVIAFQDFAAPFLNTYQENSQFAGSADFLVSWECEALIDDLLASIYFQEYANFLMEHGVPALQWLEKVRAMTHAPPFPVPHPLQPNSKSLDKDFMPFVYNMMPYFILTDIKDTYFYLSRTSVSLMELLDLLETDEYQNSLSFLVESPQYQALMEALVKNGIDVKKIYDYIAQEMKQADL